MNSKIYNDLQKASEEYAADLGAILPDEAFRDGAYWLDEQYEWKEYDKVYPPVHHTLLIRYKSRGEVVNLFLGRFDGEGYISQEGRLYKLENLKDYSIEWTEIPE